MAPAGSGAQRAREQRRAQAALRQRERRRLADEPAADDDRVKILGMESHAGIIAAGVLA